MKIHILPRIFFERIKGMEDEKFLLEKSKIISINSSWEWDVQSPFSSGLLSHPHLLCLVFDDVCNEPEPNGYDKCILFSER